MPVKHSNRIKLYAISLLVGPKSFNLNYFLVLGNARLIKPHYHHQVQQEKKTPVSNKVQRKGIIVGSLVFVSLCVLI